MDCTILIFSCDAYNDLWKPFFYFFHKHWRNCPYQIILATESKNVNISDLDIHVIHTGSGEWSARALKAVQQIDTKYLIVGLDDFFFYKDVDQEKLEQCINWMESNSDVVNFSFAPTLWPDIDDGRFPGFELRPEHAEYRVNLQMGLWRRDIFEGLLRKHENVWQFEDFGTVRANRHKEWSFYAAEKKGPRVFTYDFGGALWQGQWTFFAKQLLDENGFHIEYEKRGFNSQSSSRQVDASPPPRLPLHKELLRKAKRFLKNWRSYI